MTVCAEITTADLNTTTTREGDVVTACLSGLAETPMKVALTEYWAALHAAVTAGGAKEVVVDLRPLEFMNSSCFKTFVVWISNVLDAGDTAPYRIRFLYDQGKYWQSRSLAALTCFAEDLIDARAA